jgi:hypothetical protein
VERVKRDAQRLEQRRLGVGDLVGKRMGKALRPGDERAQRAVRRAMTREADLRTEVRHPCEAGLAAAARHRRVERNPLARAPARGDHAAELVAQHERPLEHSVADPSLDHPVPIRAAEPDSGHFDDDLPVAGLGLVLVVQSEVARAVQAQRLHVGWP